MACAGVGATLREPSTLNILAANTNISAGFAGVAPPFAAEHHTAQGHVALRLCFGEWHQQVPAFSKTDATIPHITAALLPGHICARCCQLPTPTTSS